MWPALSRQILGGKPQRVRAERATTSKMPKDSGEFDQAKFDAMVSSQSWLLRGFTFYAKYHWDPINQLIHMCCIWPILFSAIVLFADIPLPESVVAQIPAAVVEAVPFRMDNVGFVVAVAYFLWHFTLSFSIGAVANCLVIACLIGSDAWHANYPETLPAYAWALHIGCWIAQFYGHGVHEQRRPALLENLFASVFMAPIFVVIEGLCAAGFMPEFHAKLTAVVEPEVRHFHAQRKAKSS
ncbi:hypothetical protein FNF28_00925 [Cafeteria roenbergensis]|uniref:DUF962 domain-containing protein n=1 Tax=Cafeteria roenbergensis TaxID=33653 RepID=A0A5A8E1E0_CAFRO|nr:hypothetical protein FNF28_00925 [Cafeteria roenbergensis]